MISEWKALFYTLCDQRDCLKYRLKLSNAMVLVKKLRGVFAYLDAGSKQVQCWKRRAYKPQTCREGTDHYQQNPRY